MKKRILALLLCFAMVLPLVACTPDTPEVTAPSIRPPEELDWLNISTEAFDLPIVKEGTEKTLTIWYRTAGGMEDPEQTWTYKFAVEHMNINLEVRPLYSSNQSEVLSTALPPATCPTSSSVPSLPPPIWSSTVSWKSSFWTWLPTSRRAICPIWPA